MTKIANNYAITTYAAQYQKTTAVKTSSAEETAPQELYEGVELVVPEGFESKEEFLAALRERPGHVVTRLPNKSGIDLTADLAYSPGVETVWVLDAYKYQGHEGGDYHTYYRPHEGTIDPTDRQFYEDAFQFLRERNDPEYAAKLAAFNRTLDIALQELNEQIAAGKGSGLDNLTAKVKFGDVEMTLAQIHQVHGALSKASSDVWYANNRQLGRATGHDIAAVYNDAADTARSGLEKRGLSKEIIDFAAGIYQSRAYTSRDNILKTLLADGRSMDDYLTVRGYTYGPPQLARLYPPVEGVPDYETGYKTDWISKNARTAEEFYMRAFEYLRDPLDSENYWETRSAFTKQLQAALADPTRTVTIRGVEMTLQELEKVHEVLKTASDGIDRAIKAGHMQNLQTMTIYGASVASARMSLMGSGLSEEIVGLASGVYQNRMDQSMKYQEQLLVWDHNQRNDFREKVMGLARVDLPTDYYAVSNFSFERTSSFNLDAYTKFSNMDVSSASAVEKSFSELYGWYRNHMQIWNNMNGGFFKPGQLASAEEKSAFLYELKEIFFDSQPKPLEKTEAKEPSTLSVNQDIPEYHGGVQGIWIRGEFTTLEDRRLVRYNESNLGDFYAQAFEFFRDPTDNTNYLENRAEYERTLATAKQELADQIAAGKGDSLDTLTAKVNINGVEMTLAELHRVHGIFSKASEGIYEAMQAGIGENQEFTAIHALAISSVRKGLADAGLEQAAIDLAANAYETRIEGSMRNYAASLEKTASAGRANSTGSSQSTPSYYSAVNFDFDKGGSFHTDIYNTFREIDVSSDQAFEDGFQRIYGWYKDHMQQWNDKNGAYFKPGQLRSATEKSSFLYQLKEIFFD